MVDGAEWSGHGLRRRIQASENYPRAVLLTALTGMFATTFPVTVLTVALPGMAEDFDSTITTLTWAVTLPLLLSAVATPVLGKLGDLYGHRRVFLIGFGVSTVTTALTATAWNPAMLILWRTTTQVVGAATGPSSMALINSVYGPERRPRAMGWWAMVAAASPAIGLAIGGPLIEALGWQTLFVLQSIPMGAAVVVAFFVLAETPRRESATFDVVGSVTLMVGAGAIMFALQMGPDYGWTDRMVLAAIVMAPAGLYLFVRTEARVQAPLLPLDFFRRHNYSASVSALFLTGASYMGAYFITPFLLIGVFDYDIATTSAILLVRPVVFALGSPLGGRTAEWLGTRSAAMWGNAVMSGGLLLIGVGAWTEQVAVVVAGLVVQGLGHGLVRPSISTSLANSVARFDLGIAAASERMTFQVGAALGIALLTGLSGEGAGTGAFFVAFAVAAAMSAASIVAVSFFRPGAWSDEDATPVTSAG